MSYFKKETYLSNNVYKIFVGVHEKNMNDEDPRRKNDKEFGNSDFDKFLDKDGLFLWTELDNATELKG